MLVEYGGSRFVFPNLIAIGHNKIVVPYTGVR